MQVTAAAAPATTASPAARGGQPKTVEKLLLPYTWAADDKPVSCPAGLLEVRHQLRRICQAIAQQKDAAKKQALLDAKALLAQKRDAGREAPADDPEEQAKGQHLYIMGVSTDPDILKIGRSGDPHRRAMDLQGGMWFKVKVMAVFTDAGDQEKSVHAVLADRRVGNTEWFRASFADAVGAISGVL